MKKFTVIATNESTGQVVAHHVYGDSSLNAFAAAAAIDPDLTMVVALPGWQSEGEGMFFPGSAVVDAATVLDQPEVFGEPTADVTAELITEVLRAYSLRVSNTNGETFEAMGQELANELDRSEILGEAYDKVSVPADAAALKQAAFDQVHVALVAKGVIEF
ncbi:hypothetical protein [Pseudomonas aeruginosa]|uniref:hypothetical protein n=1 Tax=Pseudomonas aeruginosa TaxID=287 RepID=UPI001ADB35D3|nr:hypothetical protein [Pseudomonas aeruginosa]MBO8337208.1 hypothetical protein [Pseudomonas aeruginosa]HCF4079413.1 hypothetical protein [Pseudomonas aeruginosa]